MVCTNVIPTYTYIHAYTYIYMLLNGDVTVEAKGKWQKYYKEISTKAVKKVPRQTIHMYTRN